MDDLTLEASRTSYCSSGSWGSVEEDRLMQDGVWTSVSHVKLWEGKTFHCMGLLINTDTFLSNWLLLIVLHSLKCFLLWACFSFMTSKTLSCLPCPVKGRRTWVIKHHLKREGKNWVGLEMRHYVWNLSDGRGQHGCPTHSIRATYLSIFVFQDQFYFCI